MGAGISSNPGCNRSVLTLPVTGKKISRYRDSRNPAFGGLNIKQLWQKILFVYIRLCYNSNIFINWFTIVEAEYTFQLKKPIVPLMMQRHYRPDGWLGMLLGSKLYINFDGKYTFEHAYTMLLKELKGRGRDAAAPGNLEFDPKISCY